MEPAPAAGVVADAAGTLYGVTFNGGNSNGGAVFSLAPPAAGSTDWPEQILHAFAPPPADGTQPSGQLLLDAEGALYGTTERGGATGSGIAFRLSPPTGGAGAWTETIIYTFGQTGDPIVGSPNGGFIAGAGGALYGTTGDNVFRLLPPQAGQTQWTAQNLHTFSEGSINGYFVNNPLLMDRQGNLFGTTSAGGAGYPACTCGTVFELSPPIAGQTEWTETVLHSFTKGRSGEYPAGGLVADRSGVLYGITNYGGSGGHCACGTVFSLSPPATSGAPWVGATLYAFKGKPDGSRPAGPLALDTSGNLYDTTYAGGPKSTDCEGGCGTVFKLSKPSGGTGVWTETRYAPASAANGAQPNPPVLLSGGTLTNVYTSNGPNAGGTVFRLGRSAP